MFDVSGDGDATQSEFLGAAQSFRDRLASIEQGSTCSRGRPLLPSPPLLYVFAFSISGFIFLEQDGAFAVIEFAAPSLKPGGGNSRRSPFLVLCTTAELLPSSPS